jgi:hypothetical protein
MAKSNIATFAYRTRTVCNTEINDYWYYYRGGTPVPQGLGGTGCGNGTIDGESTVAYRKKRVRAHCEPTIVVTVLA